MSGVDKGGELREPRAVCEDLLDDDFGPADRRRCEGADERDERTPATQRLMRCDAEHCGVDHSVDAARNEVPDWLGELLGAGYEVCRAEPADERLVVCRRHCDRLYAS